MTIKVENLLKNKGIPLSELKDRIVEDLEMEKYFKELPFPPSIEFMPGRIFDTIRIMQQRTEPELFAIHINDYPHNNYHYTEFYISWKLAKERYDELERQISSCLYLGSKSLGLYRLINVLEDSKQEKTDDNVCTCNPGGK